MYSNIDRNQDAQSHVSVGNIRQSKSASKLKDMDDRAASNRVRGGPLRFSAVASLYQGSTLRAPSVDCQPVMSNSEMSRVVVHTCTLQSGEVQMLMIKRLLNVLRAA